MDILLDQVGRRVDVQGDLGVDSLFGRADDVVLRQSKLDRRGLLRKCQLCVCFCNPTMSLKCTHDLGVLEVLERQGVRALARGGHGYTVSLDPGA